MARRSPSRVALLAAVTVSGALAGPADAADTGRTAPHRWRVLAGPLLSDPSLATTYVSTYSPPFRYTTYTSHATQLLPLDAGHGFGGQLAVERALGRHAGLQISAGYGSSSVTGTTGHYALDMRYISRPPPSYDPIEVTLQRSLDWPAADGRVKTLAVALDAVAWAELGSHGRLGLVAGPAWLHTSASAESLAYTEYRLGGHSTAFSEDHRIAFEFPADSLGLDLGGFVEVDLASHVGVRLDLRYTWAPERDAAVVLLGDSPDAVFTVDLATVAHDLAPVPVRLDPSLFRAAVLLSFRF